MVGTNGEPAMGIQYLRIRTAVCISRKNFCSASCQCNTTIALDDKLITHLHAAA